MCRGIQEEDPKRGVCRRERGGYVACELCNSRASLYCEADGAFLCRKCDKWVHGANFLALRHIRCFLCDTCHNLTRRYLIGASTEVVLPAGVRQCGSSDRDTRRSKLLKRPLLFL